MDIVTKADGYVLSWNLPSKRLPICLSDTCLDKNKYHCKSAMPSCWRHLFHINYFILRYVSLMCNNCPLWGCNVKLKHTNSKNRTSQEISTSIFLSLLCGGSVPAPYHLQSLHCAGADWHDLPPSQSCTCHSPFYFPSPKLSSLSMPLH